MSDCNTCKHQMMVGDGRKRWRACRHGLDPSTCVTRQPSGPFSWILRYSEDDTEVFQKKSLTEDS